VPGKEYRRVPHPSIHGEEGPDLTPPGEGYELCRHKDVEKMRTKGWDGYYWARRTEGGDYEIRTVPSSLGEPSASGGIFPKDGFEEHYEKVDP
jgi:hypothetical protein